MKLLATTTLVLVFAMTAFAGNPLAGDGDALMKNTPICFQENRGQIVDADGNPRMDIAFTARVAGVQLYFRQDGISYVFSKTDEQASPQNGAMQSLRKRAELEEPTPVRMQLQRMDMTLAGCNPATRIRAYDPVPGVVNYYLGHCPQGITGVREYRRIVYENIYDRIDLELLTVDGKVKYNFIVRPGGDPRAIRMQYDGATETAIRHDGSLAVGTALGGIEEQAPYTYCGSEDNAVASRFVKQGSTLSFDVAAYDATQTLVIDPWATYFGGSAEDIGIAVEIDGSGNVFVTGRTNSTNFPVTASAYQTVLDAYTDVFVAKFSSTGNRLWVTYYGGGNEDYAGDLCLDGSGAVAISGTTGSNNLPVSPGLMGTKRNSWADVFVAKFSSNGAFVWGTYAGDRMNDRGWGITADASGNFYITGNTRSDKFPITTGAYMTSWAEGFLMKLGTNGNLLWSTFIWDHGFDVAVDGSGNVYVLGSTVKPTLPTTLGSFQQQNAGGSDAFVGKFSSSGSFLWATYCGGSGSEDGTSITTDPSGNVILSGSTGSTDFPVSSLPYQSSLDAMMDGFLVKLDGNGGGVWATYLGGNDYDHMRAACDQSGNVYAVLVTGSTNLPVSANAIQNSNRGGYDWYVIKFSASCALQWSTYFGGSLSEISNNINYFWILPDIAVASNGSVHVIGSTTSTDIVTVSAFQSSYAGGDSDAFIFQLDSNGGLPLPNQAPVAVASADKSSGTVPLTVQFTGSNSSDPENGPLTYHWDFGDNSSSALADPSHTFTAPGTYYVILTVTDDASNSSKAFVAVDVTAAASDVMYIAEMYTERIPQPGNKELCSYRVRIKDGNGDPMHNVYVHFQYYGPSTGEWYGITGPNGWCGIETNKLRDPVGVWSFLVDEVYEPGYTYDSTMNCHAMPYNEPVPKSLAALPSGILLHQNYPNPFNPTTVIRFELPREMAVDLVVTDALGREVWKAVGRWPLAVGEHAITFDAADLPSGIYHYRLETPDGVLARKMLLLR